MNLFLLLLVFVSSATKTFGFSIELNPYFQDKQCEPRDSFCYSDNQCCLDLVCQFKEGIGSCIPFNLNLKTNFHRTCQKNSDCEKDMCCVKESEEESVFERGYCKIRQISTSCKTYPIFDYSKQLPISDRFGGLTFRRKKQVSNY